MAYKISAKESAEELSLMILKSDRSFEEKLWKMTWGIWWTLTRVVESLKTCTLIDYSCRKYVIFEVKKYRGDVSWKMTYSFINDITNLVSFHTISWKKCLINPDCMLLCTRFRVNPQSIAAWMSRNSLLEVGNLIKNTQPFSQTGWLSVRLWAKWLRVRVQLQSLR